jgi:hypothetical protein
MCIKTNSTSNTIHAQTHIRAIAKTNVVPYTHADRNTNGISNSCTDRGAH